MRNNLRRARVEQYNGSSSEHGYLGRTSEQVVSLTDPSLHGGVVFDEPYYHGSLGTRKFVSTINLTVAASD